jgi:hypothetical protein
MCRSIKLLRTEEAFATSDEIRSAALEYVREISGYRTPRAYDTDVFTEAVLEIPAASQRLLEAMAPTRQLA